MRRSGAYRRNLSPSDRCVTGDAVEGHLHRHRWAVEARVPIPRAGRLPRVAGSQGCSRRPSAARLRGHGVRRPGLRLFDLVREKVSTCGSWGAPVTIKGPGGSGRRALHDAFVSGEDRFECETGTSWVVPAGVEHTFRVESETARLVAVFAPAGMERCFREGGVPADTPTLPPADAPTRPLDEIEQAMRAHGHNNVGPPLAPTTDTRSGKRQPAARAAPRRGRDSSPDQ